jgi:hypothetical protein
MKLSSEGKRLLSFVSGVLIALMVLLPTCQAQTASALDKNARNIHNKLSHYPSGAYLRITLRDHSDQYGSLGVVTGDSFSFTDSDANMSETHLYSDVAGVRKAKEYVDEGMGSGHHIRHLVPIAIVTAAAGTAGAIVLSMKY